jgi:hypothetical protein
MAPGYSTICELLRNASLMAALALSPASLQVRPRHAYYCMTTKLEWSEASEFPPIQRSNVAVSSVQSFFAVLQ